MAQFTDILREIEKSIERFNGKIPATQKDAFDAIQEELKSLDVESGKIKTTVKNLSLIARIKNRLAKIVLTDDYKQDVKQFAEGFNEVTRLQNEYWKQLEKEFKPGPLLKEIKNISIGDTVKKLMDAGIHANFVEPVGDILRNNITTGGSYKALMDQLRQAMTDTDTPGLLNKYAKTTTIDSINTYSAQYAEIVSSDLGFEWYKYSNSDILTTRPFCDAMTDQPYFHVSEIPQLLKATGLTYVNKKGQRVPVPIYSKTGLPHGMKEGTDASNFLVNRGGWNCGHQCRPISEGLVPQEVKDRVFSSPGYLKWRSSLTTPPPEPPQPVQPDPITPPPKPRIRLVPVNPDNKITPKPQKKQQPTASVEQSTQAVPPKLASDAAATQKEILKRNEKELKKLEKAGFATHTDLLKYLSKETLRFEYVPKGGEGKGKSFYRDSQKKVFIQDQGDEGNTHRSKAVVAHEIAHAIHYDQEIITNNTVRKDFSDLMENLQRKIKNKESEVENAIQSYGFALKHKARRERQKWDADQQMTMLDIIGSLTKGKHGGGHSVDYYNTGNMAAMEVFANAMELYKFQNPYVNAHSVLKDINDTLVKYMSDTLQAIVK